MGGWELRGSKPSVHPCLGTEGTASHGPRAGAASTGQDARSRGDRKGRARASRVAPELAESTCGPASVSELRLGFGCSRPSWGSTSCSTELLTWHDAGSTALALEPLQALVPRCVWGATAGSPGSAGCRRSEAPKSVQGNVRGCTYGSVLRPSDMAGSGGPVTGVLPRAQPHPLPFALSAASGSWTR